MSKEEVKLPVEITETNDSIYGKETFSMKGFVAGTVIGGIIGAAAALLYAPKPGSDFRTDVATQAQALKEKSVELSSVAKEKTVQISSQLKSQVEKVKAKTTKTDEPTSLDNVIDAVDESVAEATEGIVEVADANIEQLLDSTKA